MWNMPLSTFLGLFHLIYKIKEKEKINNPQIGEYLLQYSGVSTNVNYFIAVGFV